MAVTESVRRLLHFGPWVFLGFSGLDLEAEPNYLALAQESGSAVGFTWLVRQNTKPRPAVLHLGRLYGERAEIVSGDLPAWLFTLADGISAGDPDLRSRNPLACAGAAEGHRLEARTRGRGMGRGVVRRLCAMALAHLVVVSAEPRTAAAFSRRCSTRWRNRETPKEEPGSRYKFVKAAAENSLGCVLAGMGRHEEAAGWLKSAVDLAGEVRDDESRDQFALNLASSMEVLGDVKRRGELYHSSLAGFRSRRESTHDSLWARQPHPVSHPAGRVVGGA